VALRLVRPLRSFGLKTPTPCACKATSVFMSHSSAMVKTHPLTFRIEPEFNLFGGERGRQARRDSSRTIFVVLVTAVTCTPSLPDTHAARR